MHFKVKWRGGLENFTPRKIAPGVIKNKNKNK